jgi:hypothetical protein
MNLTDACIVGGASSKRTVMQHDALGMRAAGRTSANRAGAAFRFWSALAQQRSGL